MSTLPAFTNNKEAIASALWHALTTEVTGVLTASRKVKHYDQCQPQEQPAMFLEQTTLTNDSVSYHPGRQIMSFKVLIYCWDDTDIGPMPAVNGFCQQVENVTQKPFSTTLNDTVYSCQMTAIEFGGGNLGAQGVAIINIETMVVS